MPRLRCPLWLVGMFLGVLFGLTAIVVACGEDEVSQPLIQQSEQERVSDPQPEEAESTQREPTEAQQDQAPSGQQDEQPNEATTALATEQQAQEQSTASDQSQPQSVPQQQESAAQDQQSQQSAPEEAVPEGTRLITLFGDMTEVVYALGAEDFLVARDTSSIYPPVAEALPNLGFAGALNAEAILDFEPTLIIGSPMAGPPEVLEQLHQAGVEVLIIEDLIRLDAPQIKIRAIGEALGIPKRAEAVALDVEKRLEAVLATTDNEQPVRVMHVYLRRGGLQLVSGSGNEAELIIEAAGGVDAAAEVGIVGWQPLSPEALVSADPDVYLVMDRGLEVVGGVEGLLEIPGMAQTRAGKGPYVISMADIYLLGFGPRLPEAIADLAQFLREVRSEIDEDDIEQRSGDSEE